MQPQMPKLNTDTMEWNSSVFLSISCRNYGLVILLNWKQRLINKASVPLWRFGVN